MKITEILTESLSRVVYHYTSAYAANTILKTGEFQLSSTLGSVEEQYAPRGKPFFLSTTRTLTGGYHEYISAGAAMFVLDGNWFNQHYKSAPVDYWGNRDPLQSHHKAHEAEDRVFSAEPTIPTGGVTQIHIMVKPDAEAPTRAVARQTMIYAKRSGIQAYLYQDEAAWRTLDTRKTADVSVLTGQANTRGHTSSRPRGYMMPWIELIKATDRSQLSKAAEKIRYNLGYTYDRDAAARGLGTDLSNARKPNSGGDRAHAISIIKYMQANRLNTVGDLVTSLAEKWQDPQ